MQNINDRIASQPLSANQENTGVNLDRTVPPEVQTAKITFARPVKHVMPNGMPLYVVEDHNVETVRLDFVFPAGMWHQTQKLQSIYTCRMMREGCKGYSAEKFARVIDYYGAKLKFGVTKNRSFVNCYSIKKYFNQVLEMVYRMLTSPVYDEKRLRTLCKSGKQRLAVEMKMGEVLSHRALRYNIYGENHPSGTQLYAEDYDMLHAENLRDYYNSYYSAGPSYIYISGDVDDAMIDSVASLFGRGTYGSAAVVSEVTNQKQIPSSWLRASSEMPVRTQYISSPDGVQDYICMGSTMMDVTHPDYPAMRMLSTVLGGYFGSRLVKNVREEKGHTYDIGSHIAADIPQSLFVVYCDAHAGKAREVIDEVHKEMYRLQNELIPDRELQMVRNYMTGELCRDYENAFDLIGSYIFMERQGLSFDHLDLLLNSVQDTTAEHLQRLAQQYLRPELMHTVVTEGKKEMTGV